VVQGMAHLPQDLAGGLLEIQPSEALRRGLRVCPDHAHVRTVLLQLRQGPLHPLLIRMTLEVREEHVGPGPLAARAAFDAGQVYTLVGKGRQCVLEYTWPVLHRKDHAGLVPAGGPGPRAAEDYEAGGVRPGILDVTREYVQAVDFRRKLTAH